MAETDQKRVGKSTPSGASTFPKKTGIAITGTRREGHQARVTKLRNSIAARQAPGVIHAALPFWAMWRATSATGVKAGLPAAFTTQWSGPFAPTDVSGVWREEPAVNRPANPRVRRDTATWMRDPVSGNGLRESITTSSP